MKNVKEVIPGYMYELTEYAPGTEGLEEIGTLNVNFVKKGDIAEESVNGVMIEQLLLVCARRLRHINFNRNDRFTNNAIEGIENALYSLKERKWNHRNKISTNESQRNED